jgi:hypothetical protein
VDWSNERYVRWYVRDTKTWMLLGWEGQCVLGLILRKVDRSGVLDGALTGDDLVVMFANGMPPEVAQTGLDRLVKREVVKLVTDGLVVTNFILAQESAQSDALRAREARERRRFESLHPSAALPAVALEVQTENVDSVGTSRIVTGESQNVTVESRKANKSSRLARASEGSARLAGSEGSAGLEGYPEGVQGEPGRTDSVSDSDPLTNSQRPVWSEPDLTHLVRDGLPPKPARAPAVDRMALAMAARDPMAQSLFRAWQEAAGKPGARLDGKGAALWARLAAEGVTVDEVRKAVAGAKLNRWAVEEAKLAPSAILGSAEQREKFCELADHPPSPKSTAPPEPTGPAHPSTPLAPGYEWKLYELCGGGTRWGQVRIRPQAQEAAQ